MELVLGTAQLIASYGALKESVRSGGYDPTRFLNEAEVLGFAVLDTAPAYGGAESAIGEAMTSMRVHTKLDPLLSPRDSILASLGRLRRSSVEVAYFHDPEAPMKMGTAAIDRVADQLNGLAHVLGASVYDSEACQAAFDLGTIGYIQIPAHPLKRDLLEVVRLERRPGVKVLARSVLGQGLLVAGTDQIPSSLSRLVGPVADFQELCRLLGRSPLEVCLLWARDHPLLDGLVVGAASLTQLEELAHLLSLSPLSVEERFLIDGLKAPEPSLFDPRTWK